MYGNGNFAAERANLSAPVAKTCTRGDAPGMHVSRIALLSLSILGLVVTSTPAHAWGENPLALEAALGANICAANSSGGDCSEMDPLVYGRLGAHYRLLQNFALGVDIDAGGFTTPDNVTAWSLHVIASIRAMYRVVPRVRVFGGIGLGYGRLQLDVEENVVTNSLGLNGFSVDAFTIKVPAGIKIRIVEQMWLGLDFAFYAHLSGDFCSQLAGGKVCTDIESDEVMHNIQVGLFFAYHM